MKPSTQTVTKILNEICNEVDCNIPNINRGGCGVFVNELVKRFTKFNIKNFHIASYHYDDTKHFSYNKRIKEMSSNRVDPSDTYNWGDLYNVSFCHIKLRYNGFFWDSEGAVPVDSGKLWGGYYKLNKHRMPRELLDKLVSKSNNWNCNFNRTHIPLICKIMDKIFAKYGLD